MKFLFRGLLFKLKELKESNSLPNAPNFKELKKNGFTVLKGFCKNPKDVIKELEKHWNNENAWQDNVKSDTRLFGIDNKPYA